MDAVKQTRHRNKDGWSQHLNIVHQQLDVTTIETNPSTTHEHHTLCDVILVLCDVVFVVLYLKQNNLKLVRT